MGQVLRVKGRSEDHASYAVSVYDIDRCGVRDEVAVLSQTIKRSAR